MPFPFTTGARTAETITFAWFTFIRRIALTRIALIALATQHGRTLATAAGFHFVGIKFLFVAKSTAQDFRLLLGCRGSRSCVTFCFFDAVGPSVSVFNFNLATSKTFAAMLSMSSSPAFRTHSRTTSDVNCENSSFNVSRINLFLTIYDFLFFIFLKNIRVLTQNQY